jgi:hypothetical protein
LTNGAAKRPTFSSIFLFSTISIIAYWQKLVNYHLVIIVTQNHQRFSHEMIAIIVQNNLCFSPPSSALRAPYRFFRKMQLYPEMERWEGFSQKESFFILYAD